jgi:hypothetical protein
LVFSVLVYRRGPHTINVFSWAQSGESLPNIVMRDGYHTVFWRSGDLVFCVVSEMALDELLESRTPLKREQHPR